VSPVDFGFRQDAGQGVVWVGATDRLSGMEWFCEFVLRAGSAVLAQNVTLSNPTASRWPYYWWNNAAVELEAGDRFIMPANLRIFHGSDVVDRWPVNSKGIDESLVMNNKISSGFFALGSHESFLAVYHPTSRTATVHVADPEAMPGKKFWAWGTQKDANMRRALSDNHSLYVEIQAGLMPTQDDFRFFEPHQSLRLTEYWMAGRGIGGVSRANVHGVLNLERKTSPKPALVAELNVTHAIPGAHILIRKGAETVLDETADLDPVTVFSRSVPDPVAGTAYRFELMSRDGALLLAHTEGEWKADGAESAKIGAPLETAVAAAATEDGYAARGRHSELLQRYRFAEGEYRAGLAAFPSSFELKKSLGRLLVGRKRFEEAAALLSDASRAQPRNAEVQYYLGLSQAALGHEDSARDEWRKAATDAEFGPPSLIETAGSLARTGNAAGALAAVGQGLAKRPDALKAGHMEVSLLRRTGKSAEAQTRLRHWSAVAPIDLLFRVERVRGGESDEGLWQHLGADPERALSVADEYMNIGLYDDALEILDRKYPASPENQTEPGAVLPQNYALAAYYRGYLRGKLGGNKAADFKAAAAMPLDYVFPNRVSSETVLEAALQANPEDASAHWLLGLWYADSNRLDDALREWEKARTLRPAIPGGAVVESARAVRSAATAPKVSTVSKITIAPGVAPATGSPVPAGSRSIPAGPEIVTGPVSTPEEFARLALIYAATERFTAAEILFRDHFPEERQPEAVRQAFIEVQLQRVRVQAMAGACPAALDALQKLGDEIPRLPFTLYGFGAFMKGPRFQYTMAQIEDTCGHKAAARKRWSKIARATSDPASPDFAYPVLAALQLGEPSAKEKLVAAQTVLEKALSAAAPGARGVLLYGQGLLLRAAGQADKAIPLFQDGIHADNIGISQYLNLLALQAP
jgi:tetratricopeptide (TPR) repeat protein